MYEKSCQCTSTPLISCHVRSSPEQRHLLLDGNSYEGCKSYTNIYEYHKAIIRKIFIVYSRDSINEFSGGGTVVTCSLSKAKWESVDFKLWYLLILPMWLTSIMFINLPWLPRGIFWSFSFNGQSWVSHRMVSTL